MKKKITGPDMSGYEKLKASVIKDCSQKGDCRTFNPEGCDKEHCTCFHRYCDKFKWVIDRAKLYAEKTGLRWEDILSGWEKNRTYWYMNYYQDCNQPGFENGDEVRVFETLEDVKASFKGKGFRCPTCKKISEDPCTCTHCGWSVHGLIPCESVYAFAKDKVAIYNIFRPVAWRKKRSNRVSAPGDTLKRNNA